MDKKSLKKFNIIFFSFVITLLAVMIFTPIMMNSVKIDMFNGGFGNLPIYNEKQATNEKKVYLGGYPIGINMHVGGLIINGVLPIVTKEGVVTPLKDCDIKKGDVLISVNDKKVDSMLEINHILDSLDNENVKLSISRNGEIKTINAKAVIDSLSSKYKIGLNLLEGIDGIGTMTFIDPEDNRFGSLGHMIVSSDSGAVYKNVSGNIHIARIYGVDKGSKGHAGQLIGSFDKGRIYGKLDKNDDHGVFGKYLGGYEDMEMIPIASRDEVKHGKAHIVTSVFTGKKEKYEIEIVRAYKQNNEKIKGMMIRVTDPRLIDVSGGIVQGMSGSPIVQNGKLIGAVTHVFIADSTKGYATYLDWMIDK